MPGELTEKAWDQMLFSRDKGLAGSLGWSFNYHVLRSKGSQAGFPDRVIVRERVVFVETKAAHGKLSDAQVGWLTALARAGAEVYVWRPADLDEAARVLAGRWTLEQRLERTVYLQREGERWVPSSLWLPSGCRADALEREAA